MALGNCTELGVNDVYAQMLKEKKLNEKMSGRKVILEGSDNDLIHAEIEEILNDFKSKISVEGTEEKIRDVEKYPTLTAAEKSIIKSIQKVLDALADLEKVEYSGIITMVGKTKSSDSETELEQKDKEFAENQDKEKGGDVPAEGGEEFNFQESSVLDVYKNMLTEKISQDKEHFHVDITKKFDLFCKDQRVDAKLNHEEMFTDYKEMFASAKNLYPTATETHDVNNNTIIWDKKGTGAVIIGGFFQSDRYTIKDGKTFVNWGFVLKP